MVMRVVVVVLVVVWCVCVCVSAAADKREKKKAEKRSKKLKSIAARVGEGSGARPSLASLPYPRATFRLRVPDHDQAIIPMPACPPARPSPHSLAMAHPWVRSPQDPICTCPDSQIPIPSHRAPRPTIDLPIPHYSQPCPAACPHRVSPSAGNTRATKPVPGSNSQFPIPHSPVPNSPPQLISERRLRILPGPLFPAYTHRHTQPTNPRAERS